MSTELDTNIEVVVDTGPVIVQGESSLSIDGSLAKVDACIQERESIVEGYKKEYSIVGDSLYASVSADDAPQWLVSIIDSVVSVGLANGVLDLEEARNSILAALDEVEIAKNQYQELINIEATIDGILTSRLTTLNATLDQTRADIVTLEATKVSPEEALSIAADKISAELNEGAIKSQIDRIDSAYAGLSSAYSTSIDTLTSVWESQDAQISGLANAHDSLQTFIGIDDDGNVVSSAEGFTSLTSYLVGSDGVIGSADSEVANNVYVDEFGNVRSKWEYNSNIYYDGQYYSSGFGIKNVGGESQFWINADRFRFTNENITGSVTPFTIDATGTTPKITMTGDVEIDGDITSVKNLNADRITTGAIELSTLSDRSITNGTIIGKDGIKVYENGVLRVVVGKLY
jgi:hypothetical protein